MSLNLTAECDGCEKTAKLINKTMNEAPDGWVVFTLNGLTMHACGHVCAEKAALDTIAKLFKKKEG